MLQAKTKYFKLTKRNQQKLHKHETADSGGDTTFLIQGREYTFSLAFLELSTVVTHFLSARFWTTSLARWFTISLVRVFGEGSPTHPPNLDKTNHSNERNENPNTDLLSDCCLCALDVNFLILCVRFAFLGGVLLLFCLLCLFLVQISDLGEELRAGILEAFNLFFEQFSVNLSDELSWTNK